MEDSSFGNWESYGGGLWMERHLERVLWRKRMGLRRLLRGIKVIFLLSLIVIGNFLFLKLILYDICL